VSTSPHAFQRAPSIAERVRRIDGQSFAFLPHRFLRDGFLASLDSDELSLYVMLVLAADRFGVSFYHYDSICAITALTLERYLQARNRLIHKDLIAFDGTRYQVLSLPEHPVVASTPALTTSEDLEANDPATIRHLVRSSLAPRRPVR
jgi:hypothetical protein